MPGTALPNLHPAIVHFPIALLVVAFGFDVGCVALRRVRWLDRTAASLVLLGAAAAWAAVLTGERAADSLIAVPAQVQPLIGEHHDWAVRTAWTFTLVALLRVALSWADRAKEVTTRLPVRALVLAGALAGQWMLVGAADRGGALVYEHGLAVVSHATERPATSRGEGASPPDIAATQLSSIVRNEDGGLAWEPLPGDGAAIGELLDLVEGSSPVRTERGAAGLSLVATGRALLVFPEEFGDVQVEVDLEVSAGFRGVIGVVHHVRSLDDAGAFEVTTDGKAALVSVGAGARDVLDQGTWTPRGGRLTLAASAAGSHFKGLLDGATVTHGHAEPPPPGRAGLLLDGEGVVTLHALRVIILGGH